MFVATWALLIQLVMARFQELNRPESETCWFRLLNKSQIGSMAFCQLCFCVSTSTLTCWQCVANGFVFSLPKDLQVQQQSCRDEWPQVFALLSMMCVGSFGFVSAPSSTCYPVQLRFHNVGDCYWLPKSNLWQVDVVLSETDVRFVQHLC